MLEYWNDGFWDTGLLGYWFAEGGTIKIVMDNILLKNHYSIIPLFHYSMNGVKTQTSNNTLYFK